MIKEYNFVGLGFLFFACLKVVAAEVVSGVKPGSITLRAEGV